MTDESPFGVGTLIGWAASGLSFVLSTLVALAWSVLRDRADGQDARLEKIEGDFEKHRDDTHAALADKLDQHARDSRTQLDALRQDWRQDAAGIHEKIDNLARTLLADSNRRNSR